MRLNTSTFLIIEDDGLDEQLHIYVKIYYDLILLCDTGCNMPRRHTAISSLRMYLEEMPVPSNGNYPLNPWNDYLSMAKPYMIICTHCHYDHILGNSKHVIFPYAIKCHQRDGPWTRATVTVHLIFTVLSAIMYSIAVTDLRLTRALL
jgi:glyoxylase-like metal-dependent hydrolase (beta-lactamase superfamily II)